MTTRHESWADFDSRSRSGPEVETPPPHATRCTVPGHPMHRAAICPRCRCEAMGLPWESPELPDKRYSVRRIKPENLAKYEAAIQLRAQKNLSYEKIGKILGCSSGTVHSWFRGPREGQKKNPPV